MKKKRPPNVGAKENLQLITTMPEEVAHDHVSHQMACTWAHGLRQHKLLRVDVTLWSKGKHLLTRRNIRGPLA